MIGSGAGISLGRVGGVPIRVASSWFVIAAVITLLYAGPVSAYTGPGIPSYVGALAFALLLALSVLAHEAAHAIAARSFGLAVDEIVVDLWGGHTSLGTPRSPLQAFVVSVVAPLSNIAIAGAMLLLRVAVEPSGLTGFLLDAVLLANLLVGAFNLLPGLPLDGGRAAEAVVWAITGDRDRGTEIAGWGGRAVVVVAVFVVIVAPLLRGDAPGLVSVLWIVILGAMLWRAAGEAVTVSRTRRRLRRVDVGSLVVPVVVMPSWATVAYWRSAARPPVAPAEQAAAGGVNGGTPGVGLEVGAAPPATTPVGVVMGGDGRAMAVVDPAAAAAVSDMDAGDTALTAAAIRLADGAVAVRGTSVLDLAELLSQVGGPGIVIVEATSRAVAGLEPVGWVSAVALSQVLRSPGRAAA